MTVRGKRSKALRRLAEKHTQGKPAHVTRAVYQQMKSAYKRLRRHG